MKSATYKQIPALLAARESFEGNSVSAYWDHADRYHVKSYNTVIATWDKTEGVWVSDTKYSKTTSRIQNLCRSFL